MGDRDTAEAETETPRWEDFIDVDDSDLLPLLVPCSSSCSHPSSRPQTLSSLQPSRQFPSHPSQTLALSPSASHPLVDKPIEEPPPCSLRLIPGPAGAFQVAMRRQSAAAAATGGGSFMEGNRQAENCGLDLEEEDGDFNLNPWLRAMEFLGEECDLVCSIGLIKTREAERVPLVVGIVKSCTPNGLGDLFLTLKDPTGSVGASIHRQVLSDCNLGGDISVGCVLILKQVVAFCPARSIRYLNVISKNVVKGIGIMTIGTRMDLSTLTSYKYIYKSFMRYPLGFYQSLFLLKRKYDVDIFEEIGLLGSKIFCNDCGSPQKKILHVFKARGTNMEFSLGTMEGEPSLFNAAKTLLDESSKKHDHNVIMSNGNKDVDGGLLSDRCPSVCNKRVTRRPDLDHTEAGERATRPRAIVHKETRKNLNFQRTIVGGDRCTKSSSCGNIRTTSTLMPSDPPGHSFPMEVSVGEAAEPLALHRAFADNEESNLNRERIYNSSEADTSGNLQFDGVVKRATTTMPAKSVLGANEAKRLISGISVSVGQWTDEELLELFNDYPDDVDLINPGL